MKIIISGIIFWGNIMKKSIDEIMSDFGEISELQDCLSDVLENCIANNKVPHHAVSLMSEITKKSMTLYKVMDEYSLTVSE